MTGEVVEVGVPKHLLVGHVGGDQAVAIEGDVAHRVPAGGESTVRQEQPFPAVCSRALEALSTMEKELGPALAAPRAGGSKASFAGTMPFLQTHF